MTRPRYAHAMGPAAGNWHVADEGAVPGNGRGGPPEIHPVGVANPRRPEGTTSAGDPDTADRYWYRDRHVVAKTGTENSGRLSGLCDPQLSGPPRAALRMTMRNWRRWGGTDATHQYDPPRAYNPYGTQDGATVTRINGGQPGYYQLYGSRGGWGDEIGTDTLGTAVIPRGIPHGLHTHTVISRRQTLTTYNSTPQMQAGRQDRISNSTRSGQTFSQTTVMQGRGRGQR